MITKRMVTSPSIPKTILEREEEEEEEEDEEEQVPLQGRTWLARAVEQEKTRSSIVIPPSTPEEPQEVSSSKDEVQQWVNDQDMKGDDVFKMSYFDFMLMGTELVGDKIRDTPTSEPQQEDWMQMPPES